MAAAHIPRSRNLGVILNPGLDSSCDKFSDITGIFPRNNTIQLEEFDDDTRTKISNKLYEIFEITFDYQDKFSYAANQDYSNAFCKALYNDVFCQRNNLNGAYGYESSRKSIKLLKKLPIMKCWIL